MAQIDIVFCVGCKKLRVFMDGRRMIQVPDLLLVSASTKMEYVKALCPECWKKGEPQDG